MAQCHIIPLEWSETCGELRLLWSRWQARDQLIDLDLARIYFKPQPQPQPEERKP